MGWKGESRRHSLSRKGIKTVKPKFSMGLIRNIEEYKHINKDFNPDEVELKQIREIAKQIVDELPDHIYHRVNYVDFMNMLLHPENTPDKLSTSRIYLSAKELEKYCIRSERDLSIKFSHIGCPLPFIYTSPFKDEPHRYGKEYILKAELEKELKKKFPDYCDYEFEDRDILIGGNHPEEQEIRYKLSETDKRNISDRVVDIIASPNLNLSGLKRGFKNIGYEDLADKIRLETKQDIGD